MDATRDPETMTDDERRGEVADILARGLLRSILLARPHSQQATEKVSEPGESGLDLSANSPLSVAPRPAG